MRYFFSDFIHLSYPFKETGENKSEKKTQINLKDFLI